MKLLRHGRPGQVRPAMIDGQGVWRDLSAALAPAGAAWGDLTADLLAPPALDRLRALDPTALPTVAGPGPLAVPWAGLGKFIAIGLNYADHAAEAGLPLPSEPIVFMKAADCAVGADHALVLPRGSLKTDWEVELGVVIGTRAHLVEPARALEHVAGYCVVNDVSERSYQFERGGQWCKGKGCPTFGPVGPWLVTADEVPDPQRLRLWLDLNGQPMQRGSTATMVFDIATLVSHLSQFMVLQPGDLITTGTPPGVGMGRKPEPRFLQPGDRLRAGIDGLGEQQQLVHAWDPALVPR